MLNCSKIEYITCRGRLITLDSDCSQGLITYGVSIDSEAHARISRVTSGLKYDCQKPGLQTVAWVSVWFIIQ